MYRLKVYTDEEVELIANQGGIAVDRLLLHGLNNIATVLIAHVDAEERVMEAHGTKTEIAARVAWVDAQIDRARAKTKMMQKVTESGVIWAVVGALGIVAYAIKDAFMTWTHTLGVGK